MEEEELVQANDLLDSIMQTDLIFPCTHTNVLMNSWMAHLTKENRHVDLINRLTRIKNKNIELYDISIYQILAITYYRLELYDLAISHYLYFIEYGGQNHHINASYYNNIGLAYLHLDNKLKAQENFLLAIKYWNKGFKEKQLTNEAYYKFFRNVLECNILELKLDSTITDKDILNSLLQRIELDKDNKWSAISISDYIQICEYAIKADDTTVFKKYLDLALEKEKINNVSDANMIKLKSLEYFDEISSFNNNEEYIKVFEDYTSYYYEKEKSNLKVDSQLYVFDKDWSLQMLSNKDIFLRNAILLKYYLLTVIICLLIFMVILGNSYSKKKQIENRIKEQNIIIESAITNKNNILQEIHHRVKNNLEMISSIALIESSKEESPFNFQDFESRLISLATIHHLLYTSENSQTIELYGYINKLCLKLQQNSFNKFSYVLEIENYILSLDTTIAIGLLINELLTDSIKNVSKEGYERQIFINIKRVDKKLSKIIYRDNRMTYSSLYAGSSNITGQKLIKLLFTQFDGNPIEIFTLKEGYCIATTLNLEE